MNEATKDNALATANDRQRVMDGFEGSAANVGNVSTMVGSAAAVAREEAALKAAIVLARSNPRNEMACYERIIHSCRRASFARDAMYKYPRGASTVKGPSVYLAREMARIWGNIRSGVRIVSMDREYIHVMGYCHDLESNAYKEAESKFRPMHQRIDKVTGETRWVMPDDRDLRELINKQGAICERNAILPTLPSDFVGDAMDEASRTLVDYERNQLRDAPSDVLKRLVMTFSSIHVDVDMLVQYLGHPLEQVSAEELAELRHIFQSIRDGNTRREEHFQLGKNAASNDGASVDSDFQTAIERVTNKVKSLRESQGQAASTLTATTAVVKPVPDPLSPPTPPAPSAPPPPPPPPPSPTPAPAAPMVSEPADGQMFPDDRTRNKGRRHI